MTAPDSFIVHGLRVSYFTRKVTGYLDYKRLRWWLEPSIGVQRAAYSAGWNGGIPVVTTPHGELIWDSTAILLHLETTHPEPALQPQNALLRFLDFLIDDFADEWLYRHAVGSRWLYEENTIAGSLDIAREGQFELGTGLDGTRAFVTVAMTGSLPRLGTTAENIDTWISESLLRWQRAAAAHVAEHGYLFGGRPALADFALFGGNAAHFANDPVCLRWLESAAPAMIQHTHRLLTPDAQRFGDWFTADPLPESLIALLAELGRHYLPWVARATIDGSATVRLSDTASAHIETTPFLNEARAVLLARYEQARSAALDAVLERAGILQYFAPYVGQATSIPDPRLLPRPLDNRPYPAGA